MSPSPNSYRCGPCQLSALRRSNRISKAACERGRTSMSAEWTPLPGGGGGPKQYLGPPLPVPGPEQLAKVERYTVPGLEREVDWSRLERKEWEP
jgi:hypothetical protein